MSPPSPQTTIPCKKALRAGSGLTHTCPAGGELIAGRALAAVVPGDVDALGVALAQVLATVAFVNVCREKTADRGGGFDRG